MKEKHYISFYTKTEEEGFGYALRQSLTTNAPYGTAIRMARKKAKELEAKSFVFFKALRAFDVDEDE